MTSIISRPLKRFRAAPTRGGSPRVSRDEGDYGAGIIRGVAIITRGEALGHDEWVDQFAVESVARLGKAARNGIKSRFTHPSLSADGLGTMLGRLKNFRVDGDKAVADLHFQKSAHETPDGDLAKYVMDMAEEDPEGLATSIVFTSADDEEGEFLEANQNEDGKFNSPDDDNTENLPHIRIAKLWAADVVDEPAANPGGLFRQGHEIADEADRLCEYALGLSSERPTLQHLSADVDRLAQFAARFLSNHNLEVKEKSAMSTETKTDAAPVGVTLEQLNSFGDSLLSKVDERIKQALSNKPAENPADNPAEKPSVDAAALFALAEGSGLADYATLYKEALKGGLTPEEFGKAIAKRRIESNGVTSDAGQQPQDQYAAFRKEYRETRDVLQRLNPKITEEFFIRSRCRDEGLPVPEIKPAA